MGKLVAGVGFQWFKLYGKICNSKLMVDVYRGQKRMNFYFSENEFRFIFQRWKISRGRNQGLAILASKATFGA